MMNFIVNAILFSLSISFAYLFTKALMGEEEMGYKAPFWPKVGFVSLIWVSELMSAAIIILVTDPFIRPFWYNCPFSWMGMTALFSFVCLVPTFIPEQKKEDKANKVVGVTAPAACPPVDERLFWNRDWGLFVLESVQAMDDEAVINLYHESKRKMYALDDEGRNWSYMLHVNSIAFVVAMDRKLNLNI